MKRIGSVGNRWLAALALILGIAACSDSPTMVINPGFSSVRISPATPVLTSIGDSLQLALFATSSDGSQTTECKAAWESSDAQTVKVNAKGKIVGKAAGVALIIATCGEAADSTEVVVEPSIQSVVIYENAHTLDVGATSTILANAQDSTGTTITGVRFTWASSNPAVASVDSIGVVKGISAGSVDVTASVAGKSATAKVTVNATSSPAQTTPPPTASSGEFVVYPSAEIEFILGPQLKAGSSANPWPFFDQNMISRGLVHGAAFPTAPGGSSSEYVNANYYDLGLTMYGAYYRTGDVRFLEHARKVTDSWWTAKNIDEGRVKPADSFAPRNVSFAGLVLRAMDGRPEMWPWLVAYARQHDLNWLNRHYERGSLWYGVRDGGYTLLYLAQLAKVHPDAAIRAEMKDRATKAATLYYTRLQNQDGGWYWTDSSYPQHGTFGQPFHIGLLMEGLIAVHRLTNDPGVANAITRGAEWIWERGYRQQEVVSQKPDATWRGMFYLVHPDGTASGSTTLRNGTDTNSIREVRQLNSTAVHTFGYAYSITKNAKYRQWGDEVFSATFGKGQGPAADPYYNLADFREKEYNQSYRSAGRYLAWRLN